MSPHNILWMRSNFFTLLPCKLARFTATGQIDMTGKISATEESNIITGKRWIVTAELVEGQLI